MICVYVIQSKAVWAFETTQPPKFSTSSSSLVSLPARLFPRPTLFPCQGSPAPSPSFPFLTHNNIGSQKSKSHFWVCGEGGHHGARWKQEIGVKTSNEPVKKDKQQGKKKSTICHPRQRRYEMGIPTFAGKGRIIVVLTKCWTGPKPPSKTCLSKDEQNIIQKTHPNPAKDHRACGTHICSPFSD